MGNLAEDTQVRQFDDDLYHAELSQDWDLVGPNGGYVAAVALRAVGRHVALARPVSISCQFLEPPRFGPVALRLTVLRSARRATAVRVSMIQGDDRRVLEALVWAGVDLDGPQANWTPRPAAPEPDELADLRTLLHAEGRGVPAWHDCVNLRELAGRTRGVARTPRVLSWARFQPQSCFADPWVDAGRSVILIDSLQWPAVMNAFPERERAMLAPSIDLYVAFHDLATDSEWLLVQATGAAANAGTFHGHGLVWSADGRLVASGGQQMLAATIREKRASTVSCRSP